MVSLIPQSNSEPLVEFNQCHGPHDGKFCSTEGGGGGGGSTPKTDSAVTVLTTQFPNGPRYGVWGKQTGARLFHTKSEKALQAWLKKSGWTQDTAVEAAKKAIADIAYGGNRRRRVTLDVLMALSTSQLTKLRDAYRVLLGSAKSSNERLGPAAILRAVEDELGKR